MRIEQHWQKVTGLVCLLLPLSLLFALLISLRRCLYRCRLLPVYHARVPVIVVGNISVGGTGKTPLVIAIAGYLKSQGWRPAVVSRGYGGSIRSAAHLIGPNDSAEAVGDEPFLIAKRTGLPVAIGRRRSVVIDYLLLHRDCDVLISDDGLQHYRMHRDIEVVSIDAQVTFGNGFLLPAGPLREPQSRLSQIDFMLQKNAMAPTGDCFTLAGERLRALDDAGVTPHISEFRGETVHAVAGIANPASFFVALRDKGLDIIEHAFPDHHIYTPSDLCFGDQLPVLMTEKDAVKCTGYEQSNMYYLPVEARFKSDFLARLEQRLKTICEQLNQVQQQ